MSSHDNERIVNRIKKETAEAEAMSQVQQAAQERINIEQEKQRVARLNEIISNWLSMMKDADFPGTEILTLTTSKPVRKLFSTVYEDTTQELAAWKIGTYFIRSFGEGPQQGYYIYLLIDGRMKGYPHDNSTPLFDYRIGQPFSSGQRMFDEKPGWQVVEDDIPKTLEEIAAQAGLDWNVATLD
jgi:hypothetical protein